MQYAPINANGTVGTWTTTASFTTARYLHSSVAYNGYLYVLGGWSASGYLNDVQYAPINADGTVGTWTATTSFTTARNGHTSVAYNGYLYVIGGYDGSTYYNDVQYAPINANGTIGTWTSTTSFTTARYIHASVANNGFLYILGGNSGTAYLNNVQYAPINANGTIGTWTTTSSFTTARGYHTSAVYNGYLYVLGGFNGAARLNDIQYAPINADGTVGTWTTTASFTTARRDHTSVAYNGYLYVIGGNSGTSTYLNDVQYALINNTSGTATAWTATTSFTTARYIHTSVAYNGYLYVLGGYNGTSFFNDVQYVPINANGTVGTWTTTTSFATARYGHTSVAYNGYMYVIGGYNGTHFNDVQYAPINANGTVGTWTATTSFTTARRVHSSVVYNGYLYIIGGYVGGSTYLNDIQYAHINANGTVGTWTATTSLAVARYGHTSIAYNGYLYVLGGYSGVYRNDVVFAPINANGTIGAWSSTTSFDPRHVGHTSVANNGYVYIIGGVKASGAYLNDVQFAPINADGTVGEWTITNSFTTARQSHTSIEYNGYLYVLGGYDGTYLDDVQVSAFVFAFPAHRGYYSKLIDIGPDQIVDSISFSSSATNGITNITYAIAPSSTAVFGTRTTIPNAVSGTLYTTGLGTCARYAWVHFELDDTGVAEEDARRDLLDFTLNYSSYSGSVRSLRASKSSPNIHLSWSASPGATSYNVLRCDSTSGPCTLVHLATMATTFWDDPVLSDSNNYWYLVQAYSEACSSP